MLELYHWEPNTFFLKPLIALKEKETEFVSCYFDPTRFEQFAAGFPHNVEAGLHLEREGPLLRRNAALISSSFFMLEYIADALPGPDLNPGGAYEHYRARAWGQFLGLIVGPAVSALGCAKYLAPVLRQRDQQELKARIEAIEPQERRAAWSAVIDGTYDETALANFHQRLGFPVKRVESTLAINRWLTGNEYSIADIDAFAMLNTLPDLAPEVVNPHQTPRISEFLHRMRERPAVRAALAMSRTGRPQEAFVPGAEPSRWG
jgi:glutathione S-transferase/GST-like protein